MAQIPLVRPPETIEIEIEKYDPASFVVNLPDYLRYARVEASMRDVAGKDSADQLATVTELRDLVCECVIDWRNVGDGAECNPENKALFFGVNQSLVTRLFAQMGARLWYGLRPTKPKPKDEPKPAAPKPALVQQE